jgi:hypothetical protein
MTGAVTPDACEECGETLIHLPKCPKTVGWQTFRFARGQEFVDIKAPTLNRAHEIAILYFTRVQELSRHPPHERRPPFSEM